MLSKRLRLQPAYEGGEDDALLAVGANGFRLPFEADWEWAAKGGEEYKYAGSDTLEEVGWGSGEETHPVRQLKANRYGCYDFSGNIWEWCIDDYDNPGEWRPGATKRVIRGGCADGATAWCQILRRHWRSPDSDSVHLGLRLSRPVDSLAIGP